MPYPNEHACRLEDPGDFVRFRRDNNSSPHRIFGFKKGGGSAVQAYRYPKATWPVDKARAHCQDHDGSFEAATDVSKETRGGLVRLHRLLHNDWLRDGDDTLATSHLALVVEMQARGVPHFDEDLLDSVSVAESGI